MRLARRRSIAGLLGILCSTSMSAPAFAQSGASDKAAAEALFDSALKAMKEGHFAEACPKLEESQRVDPGVGTLLYLAECYEKTNRSASAWATFREAGSTARARGENERAKIANERADRLEPSLTKLEVDVAPETRTLHGLTVLRNGRPLTPSLFDVPFPVDPGKFQITVNAPGYKTFTLEGDPGGAGATKRVKIPKLEAATPEEQMPSQPRQLETTPAPKPLEPTATATSGSPAAASTSGGGLRTAGLITGALGVVGLGIGSYFGVRAIAKNSDAERYCPRGTQCDAPQGETLTHDAQSAAKLSNVTFAAGGALVIGGLVMFLAGGSANPSADKPASLTVRAAVADRGAALSVGGCFR